MPHLNHVFGYWINVTFRAKKIFIYLSTILVLVYRTGVTFHYFNTAPSAKRFFSNGNADLHGRC